MVRISLLATLAIAIASFAPTALACESECRIYPVKFLVERYASVIQRQLDSLPSSDRARASPISAQAIRKLSGRGGAIDGAIFAVFHKNCRDKPPYRSPDELCGSAKSIACFAPWDHRSSVFGMVHEAVLRVMRQHFASENQSVRSAMIDGVAAACPGQCKEWEGPFQQMMLGWEQKEHRDKYGARTPNCEKGRLGY
ncbi:hypothetical protein FBU30_002276 [Linnemannia zychae]|nr:hypothetical protein FBU30_002276 [Linnemannia zychae]